MDYAWNFCDVLEGLFAGTKSTANLYQSHAVEFNNIPVGKQKLRHNTNHDRANEYSPVKKFQTQQGALASFVIATTMGGVPLIYSSQEVAYPNPVNFFRYSAVDWTSNTDIISEYQKVMNIWKSYPVFRHKNLDVFENQDVVCFTRTFNQQEALVIVNVRNKEVSFSVPNKFINSTWNDMLNNTPVSIDDVITLSPFQYMLLINE
jgi:glycosidase